MTTATGWLTATGCGYRGSWEPRWATWLRVAGCTVMWLMGAWLVPAARRGLGPRCNVGDVLAPGPWRTWFTVWMTEAWVVAGVGDDRGAAPRPRPQDGPGRHQRLGWGCWWGRRGRQEVSSAVSGALPREVGRRQGHRLGAVAWVRRQRRRGRAGRWLRQLWCGGGGQGLCGPRPAWVLLHVLRLCCPHLCGGTRREGPARRAAEELEPGEADAPRALGMSWGQGWG